jgi:Holliday junction resolvase RusA-like endonuclease
MKRRKQKEREYQEKYSEIPKDYHTRLLYLYDKLHLNDTICEEILSKRDAMLDRLCYNEFFIVLYEEPEGSPRPRFRLVNRKNLANSAMTNSQFVHVYSITGAEDNKFMNRLVTEQDLMPLNQLICTPCNIVFDAFIKTPSAFNRVDTFLSEIGVIRPIPKPDWDNIGKKYSDMYNSNIWLDDSLVISGTVNKYYSILPRVEIHLRYLNMLYNKYQYNNIIKRCDNDYGVDYFR